MSTGRDLAASRQWVAQGTELFLSALSRTTDTALSGPTALPGWSGRHLVAHVAANGEALLNLTHWAATGQETPMYSSPEQRDQDIESGAQRPPDELRQWAAESARRLASALSGLSDDQWARLVRTAQGRTVPASEIPWLRAREVMVHALDLEQSLTFADLPEDFARALIEDIVTRRATGGQPALLLTSDDDGSTWEVPGEGARTEVRGSLPALTAYLAGRRGADVRSPSGAAPDLPPWL
ncbi:MULTISPECIES: maleylpyruvate isomerase family mycothiol-dependent enzyme [unclassified Modestobacter]